MQGLHCPLATSYLISTSAVIFTLVPHFTVRYGLELIGNERAAKTHSFLLVFEILSILILVLVPFLDIGFLRLMDWRREIVFVGPALWPLLAMIYIFPLLFVSAKFYFRIKFIHCLLIMLTTAGLIIFLAGLNFYFMFNPLC